MLEATAHRRWFPNPGPQTEAYHSEADELFYGGAAGGGKTDLACGLALEKHHLSAIFRRQSTDLRGVERRLIEIMGHTNGYNKTRKEWKINEETGQTIEFGSCKDENDKFGWQGRPHDLYIFDEITQFTRTQVMYIIGWNRSTKDGQRCRVVYTGNPPANAEGQWIKVEFAPWLDPNFSGHGGPARPGELRYFTTDPETTETIWVDKDWRGVDSDGNVLEPKSRTFIPAKLADNPHYSNNTEAGRRYRATLAGMPEPLRTQLLEGDFGVAEQDRAQQVIPTAWIREAQARWTEDVEKTRMVTLGQDVAQGGGDRSCLAPRHIGYKFGRLKTKRGAETPDGPSGAAFAIENLRDGARVTVDMGGGFGQSTYDHLISNNIDAHEFQPAGATTAMTGQWVRKGQIAPNTSDKLGKSGAMPTFAALKFRNIRAAAYWKVRELLDPTSPYLVALPPGEMLVAELSAPRWQLDPQGIKITEKKEIIKELGRSPDEADAVVIAAWEPDGDGEEVSGWDTPLDYDTGSIA